MALTKILIELSVCMVTVQLVCRFGEYSSALKAMIISNYEARVSKMY